MAEIGHASGALAAFLMLGLTTSDARAVGRTGTVCLAALPPNARELDWLASARGEHFKYKFWVSVDGGRAVDVGATAKTLEPISLAGKHRIGIFDAGSAVTSFRFTFAERGGSPLCLRYSPGFQTWSLVTQKWDPVDCGCALLR